MKSNCSALDYLCRKKNDLIPASTETDRQRHQKTGHSTKWIPVTLSEMFAIFALYQSGVDRDERSQTWKTASQATLSHFSAIRLKLRADG